MADIVGVDNNLDLVLSTKSKEYICQAKATNTVKSYRADWQDFTTYCYNAGAKAIPADIQTVIDYLTQLADIAKVSTITRRVSAISQAHQAAGVDSPTHSFPVRTLMAGIRKSKGTAQVGKVPILTDDIRAMIDTLPNNLLGFRDRALLLLGFAGAFRRSELVSLNLDDLTFGREGITVLIRKSKTDQEGVGIKKGIPYGSHLETCPVRALQDWLAAADITDGALFHSINRHGQMQGRLSDKAVSLIVKRTAQAAGLNPNNYAGHSLRAGLATSAAMAGVQERIIMQQTGHKSVNMVRKYIRDGSLFRENAAAQIGL